MGLFDLFRKNPGPTETPSEQPTVSSPSSAPTAPPTAPSGPPNPFSPISEDQWDAWEDDDRMKWCMSQFEVLKTLYGEGKLKRVTADESLILRTTYRERPISIALDYTTGWVTIKMRFVNRLGHLVLQYDEDKQVHHSDSNQQGGDSEWEDEDATDQVTHVFAPGVYIEEYDVEARPMIAMVEGLPATVRDAVFCPLQRKILNRLFVDAESIEAGTEMDFHGMHNPKDELDRCFGFMLTIAEHFASGSSDLSPKARVYIHGQPVFPNGVPQRTPCTYCSTPYVLSDDDPRCPSCGAING